MTQKKYRYFVADFETTVYEGQRSTEVWAAACVELGSEDLVIHHSIDSLFSYLIGLKSNLIVYFHNLKFDGSFWLPYLIVERGFKQAYVKVGDSENDIEWIDEKYMENGSFKYSISDKGMWYTITIKYKNHFIEIRDSLKLLPFSVRKIGKSFGTKHKKLDMEYKGYRYAGCPITEEEKRYIANDVLVVKEALEIMFDEGHTKLTIGACCLAEYKRICKSSTAFPYEYNELFPDLYTFSIDSNVHRYSNADEWIRKSYRGGWCYLVKGKENRLYHNGLTADVNSLYPSMMSSESGNRYPVGLPHFWVGNVIPDEALLEDRYYYIRIKTRFYIREGKLPFIQIKGNYLYCGTESLTTSDVYDSKTGQYYTHYKDTYGNTRDTRVELTLSMTDYQLFLEHYEPVDFEIIDGCWFYTEAGIFDEYIDKYRQIKQSSTGAIRELAKLYLNNLYGKLASSADSSFKVAFLKSDGALGFLPVPAHDKKPGFIAVGAAITSYAREFTIRAAQKNYYGVDKPGFIYADTDSLHMDLPASDVKGLKVHETAFCSWKLEASWDVAVFTRQKTYIEHVVRENLVPIDKPFYNIKCAGMPERCKTLFNIAMNGNANPAGYEDDRTGEWKEWTKEEKEFLFRDGKPVKMEISDFKRGLKVPGKLLPKRIPGGIVLKDTAYEMR